MILGLLAAIVATTVTASEGALALTGPTSPEVPENTTAVGSYTASAAEGTTVTWSLEGPDMELLAIADGILTFSAAPDYEAPGDQNRDNVHEITVVASAGESHARMQVRITVTDVDEPPTATADSIDIELEPGSNTQVPLEHLFRDPEEDNLSFSLTAPEAELLSTRLNDEYLVLKASGEITETSITVEASDRVGTAAVSITLSTADTAPRTRGDTRPSPPRNFTATPHGTGFQVTWTTPFDTGLRPITGYVVRHRVSGSIEPFDTHIHMSTFGLWFFIDFLPETEYEFMVQACHRNNFVGNDCGLYATTTGTPWTSTHNPG